MGKKVWIGLAITCVLIVAAVLVLMLVFVPQVTHTVSQANEYEKIAKQEYTFSGEEVSKLKKEYGITSNDVNKAKKTEKYEEGNINPFTPKNDVNIYNEPTLENEGSTSLTPDKK